MGRENEEEPPQGGLLSRLRGMVHRAKSEASQDLEREIQDLVEQGEAQGLIGHGEGQMIDAVLEMGETTAGQIMSPRTELAAVPVDVDMDRMIQLIVDSGHSRIPVFSEDPDHIMGVVHAKDLLPFCACSQRQASLAQIARPPMFVPYSMPINQLLSAFKRGRTHLAIVVDEYGGTAGVVTMEDVLEEIVGDIADEHDQEEPLIVEQADGALLADARVDVEELSERLGAELPDELPEGRYESLGGLITTLLGRVPVTGEQVMVGPVEMVVKSADERRVVKVLVRLASAGQDQG